MDYGKVAYVGGGNMARALAGGMLAAGYEMTHLWISEPLDEQRANYDAMLISWAAQPVQSGVIFGAGNSKYSAAAASARQSLIDKGWNITDGGQE